MTLSIRSMLEWTGLHQGRCPVCAMLTARGVLCETCASALAARTGGYCPGCGEIFADETMPLNLCGACRLSPEPWGRFFFHAIHTGALRDLILGYKFNNATGSTRLLAEMLAAAFLDKEGPPPDIIVPVPLHKRRLLWRGFNQSTELCRPLSQQTHSPIVQKSLVRTRYTQPQTMLGRAERRENIKSAFTANTDLVRGNRVLLVDDVYTTGATLRECTVMLKQAGATRVDVLVLARAMQ
ncbi:ComF family protein [Pseudodesulfovibrio piezophilus]|uniref:Phosphoribosyltransferase n=1 Tax=Pseudodesulfovibrio piezophilus (strain DSM 21447 / JCM 15486 / C1TLV30) TaxID=1322246 RepID=M1WRV2_PSEP2|nr:ComF family protein [Pseudodesulfovibrio piezophilus]CCH48537.1 Phosphoribosyltransferase [Pseudodesulfovibrio piezophilus C1TLV30]